MAKVRVGVIAAAGKGTRAYPRSSYIPKPLFRFDDRTLLEINARILFDTLKIQRLYVIIGHLSELVTGEVERLRTIFKGKEIFTKQWTGKGLAADIASLRSMVNESFILILGDEFYYNSSHGRLLKFWQQKRNIAALIAVWQSELISNVRKNYSVELQGQRVKKLIEKPQHPPNNITGLGTYFFNKDYFSFFDKTPPSRSSGIVEITEVIDLISRETNRVYACDIGGRYYNINSLADYYAVNYMLRSQKFDRFKISLIIPTLNNAATIMDVISDYKPSVDEIIVVDMGSSDKTITLARKAGVRIIKNSSSSRKKLHSARAIYNAMFQANGDIIVLTTADGSFRAHDLPKLLEYLKDCDMAVGTRTTRQLIEQGSNLNSFYRWINVAFGKLVEILWWGQEPRYTDIGCIYRAIWKTSFEQMSPDLRAVDKTYSVEMMIEILRYHMRCIEVPVSYYQYYGHSQNDTAWEHLIYFGAVTRKILTRRFRFVKRTSIATNNKKKYR